MTFAEAFGKLLSDEVISMRLYFWADDCEIKIRQPSDGGFMTMPYLYADTRPPARKYYRFTWTPTQAELFEDRWEVREK